MKKKKSQENTINNFRYSMLADKTLVLKIKFIIDVAVLGQVSCITTAAAATSTYPPYTTYTIRGVLASTSLGSFLQREITKIDSHYFLITLLTLLMIYKKKRATILQYVIRHFSIKKLPRNNNI